MSYRRLLGFACIANSLINPTEEFENMDMRDSLILASVLTVFFVFSLTLLFSLIGPIYYFKVST